MYMQIYYNQISSDWRTAHRKTIDVLILIDTQLITNLVSIWRKWIIKQI